MVEFDHLKKEAGLPTFTMSVGNWVEKTNAIGIMLNKSLENYCLIIFKNTLECKTFGNSLYVYTNITV